VTNTESKNSIFDGNLVLE